MQVDPIKPTLKPPGMWRLKAKYDVLLSSFALKFNLRRYMKEVEYEEKAEKHLVRAEMEATKAGAYTRRRFSSTSAGLVTPDRVPLSDRLGEIHAYIISH